MAVVVGAVLWSVLTGLFVSDVHAALALFFLQVGFAAYFCMLANSQKWNHRYSRILYGVPVALVLNALAILLFLALRSEATPPVFVLWAACCVIACAIFTAAMWFFLWTS